MASPKTCIPNQGFTLIEIVVVISLISIIGGLAMLMSMDTFRNSAIRDERDVLVSTLQRARSMAVNNICSGNASVCVNALGNSDGKPHGVHIQPGSYVIFQGDSYIASDPANETVQSNAKGATVTSTGGDPVFKQLSGIVNAPVDITIEGAGHKSIISVNQEGRIAWEDEGSH